MAVASISDQSSQPVLEAKNICLNRGFTPILQDICIKLYPGEIVHLKGPNGAGKTTLLNILGGILTPHAGRIERHVPLYYPIQPFAFRGCVEDHLEGLSRVHGHAYTKREIIDVLDRVGAKPYRQYAFEDLSAGYQQRLLLAYLLLFGQQAVWLLDEPSSHLDTQGIALLTAIMEEHLRAGTYAILFTSHQPLMLTASSDVREVVLHG